MLLDVYVRVRLEADDPQQAAAVVRGALAQEELDYQIGSVHEARPATWHTARPAAERGA